MIRFDDNNGRASQTVVADFCDRDLLSTRVELLGEVMDYLMVQLGEADIEAERKRIVDLMLSLRDLRQDLKELGRVAL